MTYEEAFIKGAADGFSRHKMAFLTTALLGGLGLKLVQGGANAAKAGGGLGVLNWAGKGVGNLGRGVVGAGIGAAGGLAFRDKDEDYGTTLGRMGMLAGLGGLGGYYAPSLIGAAGLDGAARAAATGARARGVRAAGRGAAAARAPGDAAVKAEAAAAASAGRTAPVSGRAGGTAAAAMDEAYYGPGGESTLAYARRVLRRRFRAARGGGTAPVSGGVGGATVATGGLSPPVGESRLEDARRALGREFTAGATWPVRNRPVP